jgi:hypothetical protein
MKELDINAILQSGCGNVFLSNINKNKAIEIKDKFNMFNIQSKHNESSNIEFLQFEDDRSSVVDLGKHQPKQNDKNVKFLK